MTATTTPEKKTRKPGAGAPKKPPAERSITVTISLTPAVRALTGPAGGGSHGRGARLLLEGLAAKKSGK